MPPEVDELSLRIAIIGSGPSGFYAAQTLFRHNEEVRCDLFDRLPTPFGLVRGGVAPDHQKIKRAARAYDKIAAHPRFRWFGNVEIGRDVSVADLLERYDQVVLAIGALSARKLGIPGEDLDGCFSATEFVAWYNGHPDFQDRSFPVDVEDVVVVGVGNVSMDVSRVLACTPEHLAPTDITDAALSALGSMSRKRIHVLGRRGPAQAAYTPKEIHEIDELDGIDVRVRKDEATLDPLSAAWVEAHGERAHHDNIKFAASRTGPREAPDRCEMWLRFCCSPVEVLGDGKVEAVRIEKTEIVEKDGRLRPVGTGRFEVIPAGLVLTAVGYRSVPIPGVPFDDRAGRIPNREGQVMDGDSPVDDLFVVGWAKRGPTGLIGTNRHDSNLTADLMLEVGVKHPAQGPDPIEWLLEVVPDCINWQDWKRIDAAELAAGEAKGKIREKFTDVAQMLAAAQPD